MEEKIISLEQMYEMRRLYVEESLSPQDIAEKTGYSKEVVGLYAMREAFEWDSELRSPLEKYCAQLNLVNRSLGMGEVDSVTSLFRELWHEVTDENPKLSYLEKIAKIKEKNKNGGKK